VWTESGPGLRARARNPSERSISTRGGAAPATAINRSRSRAATAAAMHHSESW
jgi:hypothetical protein